MGWLSILIGVFLGVFSSLIAWGIIFHMLRPKLNFSLCISKFPTKEVKSGFKYRFKLENCGCRPIIDVKLTAKLSIQGLRPDLPLNWASMYIPLDFDGEIAKIEPGRKGGIRPLLNLKINNLDLDKDIYPLNIKNKSKSKTLLLEDIFKLGSKSKLQIIGFGYDIFSGARSIFESKSYTSKDIEESIFNLNSIDIEK